MFEARSKLEEMEGYCFWNSGLEEITLPKTVKEIDESAFEDCGDLRSIHLDVECEASLY